MDLYHVLLFAHIIGAVILVGVGFVSPLIMGGARRSQTVSGFRDWVGVMQKISKTAGMSAGVVFLSGLYMGLSQHSFTAGWLAVSLVLFVINGSLAGGVLDKHLARVIEATGDAADGPVPVEAQELAHSPRMHGVEALMLGNDFAIVFLMTNKPGWAGALVTAAAGLAIAGGIIARARTRRDRTPAVAA